MFQRIINGAYRRLYFNSYKKRSIQNEQEHEERLIMSHTNPNILLELTDAEKRSVVKMWRPVLGENLRSFEELALFKYFRSFDPRFVSHYMYLPILAHKLHNYHYTTLFEHKSLLGRLSRGGGFPYCYVRSIDGEFYDNEMRQLSEKQAIDACASQNVIILKDSSGTSGGQSFEKLNLGGKNFIDRKRIIQNALRKRGRDFVVQQFIIQHPSFSRFNYTSLNTLRVTTLYLNGKFSTLSIILRMGKAGMEIDNWGGGGIIVGVNVDGVLHETGYENNFTPVRSNNGIVFKGIVLDQVPALLKLLENQHSTQFSLCKLIGWDVTFDEENKPIIIELNSSQPGLIGEQVCTGPIFGDRTDEVIQYCAEKTAYYNRSIFTY